MKDISSKPLTSGREWQEEEVDKLKELFVEYKTAENPSSRIYEQWKEAKMPVRSKRKLVDKIIELGLETDRSKLGKVRRKGNRKPKEGEKGFLQRASDTDSALNDSSSGEEEEEEGQPAEFERFRRRAGGQVLD